MDKTQSRPAERPPTFDLTRAIAFSFACFSVGTTVVILIGSLFYRRSDVSIILFWLMSLAFGLFGFIGHTGYLVEQHRASRGSADDFPPLHGEGGPREGSIRDTTARPVAPPNPHSNLRTTIIAAIIFGPTIAFALFLAYSLVRNWLRG